MKRVVFNQKGGVGKTSITCNLAAIDAATGYRTLVVDLDVHQGDGTATILAEEPEPLVEPCRGGVLPVHDVHHLPDVLLVLPQDGADPLALLQLLL